MNKGKGQEIEYRRGVQSTVQHDGGGFEFEDIARQCGVTRQTVLQRVEEKTKTIITAQLLLAPLCIMYDAGPGAGLNNKVCTSIFFHTSHVFQS